MKIGRDGSAGYGGGIIWDSGAGGQSGGSLGDAEIAGGAEGGSLEDVAIAADAEVGVGVDSSTPGSLDSGAAERTADVTGSVDIGSPFNTDAAAALDAVTCNGSAMVGTWYRALDGLSMILTADGCAIRGTADNAYFRHTIEGTYDESSRTTIGTIRRTSVSTGCVTIMNATWVLTDAKHFTLAIVRTDGQCDIGKTYNEVTTYVRISP